MGQSIDFLVIGAQRSGTTSLWQHLASHPEIYVPPSKEAPFFSHDEPFSAVSIGIWASTSPTPPPSSDGGPSHPTT